MEKHIKLVAIFNIVYRSILMLGSIVLFILAALFGRIMEFVERSGDVRPDEIPNEILGIVPVILVVIGVILAVISIIAIIGSVGFMKRQEWGRVTLLVVSVFNLMHIPIGTALGVYTLWVILNDEIVRIYNPLPPA